VDFEGGIENDFPNFFFGEYCRILIQINSFAAFAVFARNELLKILHAQHHGFAFDDR
jgi:hypothetical protein